MHLYARKLLPFIAALMVVALLGVSLLPPQTTAQEGATPTPGTSIQFSGVVEQIGDGTLTIGGFMVDTRNVVNLNVTVGVTVTVTGYLSAGNIIIAQTIIIITTNNPTGTPPTLTPTATTSGTPASATPTVTGTLPTTTPSGTPTVVVIVEGPVQVIVNNIITIYNLNIVVAPQHPILTLIDVGDIVLVEGNFDVNGMVVATLISNIATSTTITDTTASVGLDGPVESINGNLVVVNGITVQFDPADPILASLQVGHFISVQGNFTQSGNTIVLIVINITIITNVTIGVNPQCWYHEPGMGMGMGHWHCDGMGMGMGMGQ